VKTRVHLLAKELAIEPKELIAQLEKLGIKGKKVQSALEDEEVSRLKAALTGQAKPQVTVGEEKVVADRVVTAEDEKLGEIQAREKIVERRVQANVIRRRTSRVEVIVQVPPTKASSPAPADEERAPAPETPAPVKLAAKVEPAQKEEKAQAPQAQAAETVAESTQEAAPAAPSEESRKEEPKGARILGRIDLRKAPAADAGPAAPAEPPWPPQEARTKKAPAAGEAEAGAGEEAEGEKVTKPRHKKRVIKKQDVIEQRGRDFRPTRVPKKKRALPGKEQKKTEITVPKASKRVVRISEVVSVGDLARLMGVKAGEVIKKLMQMGMISTINQVLDADTATLIAAEFDYQVENIVFDVETALEEEHHVDEPATSLRTRPSVVTIMGHVDHGKTSLLDSIRSSRVTEGEAGGITQHIGAYHVQVDGRSITFIDTPGHEAFTAMRARGAKVTDIVVLVVAADDGVMPQTVEAINHARAAEVPIIVAVNKIDKPDANLERVKKGLADHGLVPEDWGGDAVFVPVSARTKEGIPQLLEMILLQTDVLDLQANPEKLARGTIIEAKLDRGRGPVATVLVQEGTLRVGDAFVCGAFHGRVRAMIDDRGEKIDAAPPSLPVEILGFQGVPQAGDGFVVLGDEAKARQIAEYRQSKQREAELVKTSKVSLEDLYDQIKTGDVKELRVVLKADVHGSVEALTEAMNRLSNNDVMLRVIHGSVGGITESDVLLASASNAILIGFNVRPESKVASLATKEGVDVRCYTVIYEVIADLKAAMEGMLKPTYRERVHGRLEVRQTFNVSGAGVVAGCYVAEGKIQRSHLARLLRDQVVVYEGRLASLKRFKDDVREVAAGYECGVSLEDFQDVKVGDVIESYEKVLVARRMSAPTGGREGSRASAAEPR
jgi:translation initiation factor IF-2